MESTGYPVRHFEHSLLAFLERPVEHYPLGLGFLSFLYLFWEALCVSFSARVCLVDPFPRTNQAHPLDSPPPSPIPSQQLEPFRPDHVRSSFKHSTSVALDIQSIPLYLDRALLELGLDTEARTSFITYAASISAKMCRQV